MFELIEQMLIQLVQALPYFLRKLIKGSAKGKVRM